MGRSHKKSRHSHGSGGGGGSNKKKKKSKHSTFKHQHHQLKEKEYRQAAMEDTSQHRTGWKQQDYQRAAGIARQLEQSTAAEGSVTGETHSDNSADDDDPSSSFDSYPQPRRKKRRSHTPSWMIDPERVEFDSSAMTKEAAVATASGLDPAHLIRSSADPSVVVSSCWNDLPRDCLLHVFSFYDFFTLTRLTGINHFWLGCIKRGLMNRVIEHSWKLLRQPRKMNVRATAPSESSQIPALPSISSIISPLFDDEIRSTSSSTPTISFNPPISSPSLSSLPLSQAFKSISTLALPSSNSSLSQSSISNSSALSLFKSSLIHIHSLYIGQKQLRYSLHSNPLYQHLWLMYHVSLCHQKVVESIQQIHILIYRNVNHGKWPRSTKPEADNAPYTHSMNEPTFDLMPLHRTLDLSAFHRDHFLSQLQFHQKPVWTFLHDQPVTISYGFGGRSLSSQELEQMYERMSERLKDNLKRQKGEAKSRYAGRRNGQTNHSNNNSSNDPPTSVLAGQDNPSLYVRSIGSSSSSSPLLTSQDANHIASIVRRMAVLTGLWGKYLHSDTTIAEESSSSSIGESPYGSSSSVPSSFRPSSRLAPLPSSLDRCWDEIAVDWLQQSQRLERIQLFWSEMSSALGREEKDAMLKEITKKRKVEQITDESAQSHTISSLIGSLDESLYSPSIISTSSIPIQATVDHEDL